ncbi:MAG: transposase [Dehalococcoidales bacterium]|nr:transposase [Dehalococcoidales bacterium]
MDDRRGLNWRGSVRCHAREAGFLPEKLRQLFDSTPMKGAGEVQDTYTLLRKGIKKLLRAMGFDVPSKRRGLQTNLERYLDSDKKAEIDWSDPKARAEQLKVLVRDADAALDLAVEHADDEEVRLVGWLLTKILGDDIEIGEDGEAKLGQGVARDRMISWTDPEMRHGRKSASQRWDGDKVQVAEEPETELITEIEVVDASAGDGASLLPMVQSVEEHLEVKVEHATGDMAYGSVDNRVKCAEQGIDLVSPVAAPGDPEVAKSAFEIDEIAGRATCPQGQTTTVSREVKDDAGWKVKQFIFEREVCVACPLFQRCVKSKTSGRTVTLNFHEEVINEARERQATEEFKEKYKERPKVERKIAELVRHGLRQARYIGRKKKRLQALWTAALVNMKRLFKLFGGDVQKVRAALIAVQRT